MMSVCWRCPACAASTTAGSKCAAVLGPHLAPPACHACMPQLAGACSGCKISLPPSSSAQQQLRLASSLPVLVLPPHSIYLPLVPLPLCIELGQPLYAARHYQRANCLHVPHGLPSLKLASPLRTAQRASLVDSSRLFFKNCRMQTRSSRRV